MADVEMLKLGAACAARPASRAPGHLFLVRVLLMVMAPAVGVLGLTPVAGTSAAPARAAGDPFGSVDTLLRVPGGVEIHGWAIDPDTSAPIAVHVYVGSAGTALTADIPRPDVAAAYPGYGQNHGYAARIPTSAGTYTVCAYAINVGAGSPYSVLGCRAVTVSAAPFGNVDVVRRVPAGIEAAGWVIDPDTSEPTDVDVYIDGSFIGRHPAHGARPDVAAAFPGYGAGHGFSMALPIVTGQLSSICVFAINRGPGGTNPALACQVIDLTGTPGGSVDWAQGTSPNSMAIAGWAIDPDTAAAIDIHIYVDGSFYGVHPAALPRPDIGALFPAHGSNHGFQLQVSSRRDQHVCVYAIDRTAPGTNVLLGCRIDPTTGRPPPHGAPVSPFVAVIRDVTPADYGNAWRPGCPVGPASLRHLTVSYWGFDGQYREGGIVAHWTWVYHLAYVFNILYDHRFQFERVEPITQYAGPGDDTPDQRNVTSAFVCRPVTGGGGWSEHSYGLAIDMNPVQNPYARGGVVIPDPAGRDYLDRSQSAPAMVNWGVVQTFAAIGWHWGGYWQSPRDYMHFSLRNR